MEKSEFQELRSLLLSIPSFENWKVLQQNVLENQLKIDQNKIKNNNSNEIFKLRIYQRFIDAIFWTHVNYQLTDVRRVFYSGTKVTSLLHGNFDSHKKAVNETNNNSDHFALHSDLATNIAIGDVIYLMANDTFFVPVELKEGIINNQIIDALNKMKMGDRELYSEIISDKKKEKQLKRVQRQIARMEHEMKLYRGEEVMLPSFPQAPLGGSKKVIYQAQEPQSFEDEIIKLLNDPCPEGWKSKRIDGCLEVVLIRSQDGIESFLNQANKNRSIYVDIVAYNFQETFSRPLVSFNFSTDDLWDLLTGKISVFLLFSIEDYLIEFSNKSVDYKKITGRKYRKLMQAPVEFRPSSFYEEFAISTYSEGETQFFWTEAMSYRMYGCLQRPSAIHKLQIDSLNEAKKMIENIKASISKTTNDL